MQVSRQNLDAQNALLKVEIENKDYAEKVQKSLDKHRKTAKIPGFRPGTVPLSLIQKKYGKAVLAEELNKLSNEGVSNFIRQNNIEILGHPIPKMDADVVGDFDRPDQFEFIFEIGLVPTFDYHSVLKGGIEYNTVRVDDNLVTQQIEDIQRRYGKLVNAEHAEAKDMVLGQLVELNEDGTVKENGVKHNTTVSLEYLDNPKGIEVLLGKKKEDVVHLDPDWVSKNEEDKISLLGIKAEDLPNVGNSFQFTVTEVKRMEKAEMNEELFAKLFREGEITDETGLRARIHKDLEQMFEQDADRLLTRKAYDLLVEKVEMNFPETFLKKWIKMSSENPISDEDLNKEFDGYLKSLKWQMIQTRIFKDAEIRISNEEVITFTKGLMLNNYAQYGIPAPEDAELEASARNMLSNKEQANGIYDQLAEQKLTSFFKSNMSLKMKPLTYEVFVQELKK
ncbi:MAG: trigger factor [Flavobacteriia bacterium]|nr:trigger factor [Flavobacteriia bacterium]